MGRWAVPIAAIALLGAAWAGTAARAEPARAEPVCKGQPAKGGQQVRGPILEVIDDRTVCVATGAQLNAWVPVTLARPAQSRPALMAAAFGKNAACLIGKDGRGQCMVEGAPLGQLLRQPEIQKAALAWR